MKTLVPERTHLWRQTVRGETSEVQIFGDRIEKRQTNFLQFNLLRNEHEKLRRFSGLPHFPQVLAFDGQVLTLTNVGSPMSRFNIPPNWARQLGTIIRQLRQSKVVHRDIRPQNFLTRQSVVYLIDFGWAVFDGENGPCPPGLGGRFRPPTGNFDDLYSIEEVSKLYATRR